MRKCHHDHFHDTIVYKNMTKKHQNEMNMSNMVNMTKMVNVTRMRRIHLNEMSRGLPFTGPLLTFAADNLKKTYHW